MPQVLIIGGGIAGIKAALTLQQHSIDYLLLEAQSRLGGRLRTVEGINSKYDLGASWFHETLDNKLFDEEVNLNGGVRWIFDDGPVLVMDRDGPVSPMLKLESIVNEMEKYVEMECLNDHENDDTYYNKLIQYLHCKKHLLSDEQIGKVLEYARGVELWHGIDIKRLSAKYASLDNQGRDALALNYDAVLQRHTDQLDISKVLLNTAIVSVEKFNNGKNVRVETFNGEVYEAEYLIMATPQSILQIPPDQSGHIKFIPQLPTELTNALQKIHYGSLGKVILEFDSIFWETEHERFFVLSDSPPGFINSIMNDKTPSYELSDDPPLTWQYPLIILNYATTLQTPTLVILTQSPLTEYLESTPSLAWHYFSPIIQKLIKHPTQIQPPTNVIVTDWSQNAYQRGSYVACFPNDDPITAVNVLETGWGRVRFAGEHTIMEGTGCVHGAWASGIREAEYVIREMGL